MAIANTTIDHKHDRAARRRGVFHQTLFANGRAGQCLDDLAGFPDLRLVDVQVRYESDRLRADRKTLHAMLGEHRDKLVCRCPSRIDLADDDVGIDMATTNRQRADRIRRLHRVSLRWRDLAPAEGDGSRSHGSRPPR